MSAKCQHCGKESPLISQALGVCLDCIRQDFIAVLPDIQQAHSKARSQFNLPAQPPESETGRRCQICLNECCIPSGGRGYCGLRFNEGNKLRGARADRANVSWYYDPLPTTSRRHAEECLAEAKAQGLKRVRLGNIHLLGEDY